jgi:uncharacterized protein (TIGR00730 family)
MAKRFCVFCGSSSGSRQSYAIATALLARYLVANGISIVYGGGSIGLMGVLANAVIEQGGKIIGIIPKSLVAKEGAHAHLSSLRIVDSIPERKALMAQLSDGFIALPGGFGTLAEFCEVLTLTQLGLQHKPCGILNIEGYYDTLLRLFDDAVSEQFLKPVHRELVFSDSRPDSLVTNMLKYKPPLVNQPTSQKQS